MKQAQKLFVLVALLLCVCGTMYGQFSSGISGLVTDPTGGVVPNAAVQLTNLDTGVVLKTVTSSVGIYSFPNLPAGNYSLRVTASGYEAREQSKIIVELSQQVRLDQQLTVGSVQETVKVTAAVALNRDDATVSTDISPDTIIQLPLVVGGSARSAADFVQIIPGTNSTSGTGTANLRINGGQAGDGESVLNGVSMEEGGENLNGLIALTDLKISPDMVSELNVQTSNYSPQYGTANSGVILEDFRTGTDKFHGAAWEYGRNTDFNAKAWNATTRSQDNQHDFGFRVGGPIAVPILTSGRSKTFFFGLMEWFRVVGGSGAPPQFSLPTLAERGGDFSDRIDAKGNLIPIYDPATTTTNAAGQLVRQQFMGCDGVHPNVICATDPRLASSYANAFIKYLPSNTCTSGFDCLMPGINNNYTAKPIPNSVTGNDNNYILGTIDNYLGQKEHFSFAIYHSQQPSNVYTYLPVQIDSNTYNISEHNWLIRGQYDHTFSPTLLNHFGFGYQNLVQLEASVNAKYASDFPAIAGVPDPKTQVPQLNFSEYSTLSGSTGAALAPSGRPAYIYNDLVTWVKGKHTLKIGGEYRWLESINGQTGGQGGNFNLTDGATGIDPKIEANSGNSFASFLLDEVDSGSATYYTVHAAYMRQNYYTVFAGDTWKFNPKLSLDYGLRWDVDTPSYEKNNNLSFLDIKGANSGAGGLPGREAWAGNKWGPDASYGKRYPEKQFWKAFSPRLGAAYSVDAKTVVRAGYGIFFNQAYYDGWGEGGAIDGLNQTASVVDSNQGLIPAFNIATGFAPPAGFKLPPNVSSTNRNGQNFPNFRAVNGNNQGYTQQWNLTWERQLWKDMSASIGYVGNKGTHLHSQIVPINAIDPAYLNTIGSTALGAALVPGANGVNAPFAGFTSQGAGCNTVALALAQFPQYCNTSNAVNENQGDSRYDSLQLTANKRFSEGLYFLTNYTWSKTLSNTGFVEESENSWNSNNFGDSISPFERKRNKTVPIDTIGQSFNAGYVYELPVGPGKLLNVTNPVLSRVVGGWQTNGIIKLSGGTPLFFRDGNCHLPSLIAVNSCPVAQIKGVNPWLTDKHNLKPNVPALNIDAFEPASNFTGNYLGSGPKTSGLRTSGYKNIDAGISKSVPIKERFSIQIRADLFNAFNNHYFVSSGFLGGQVFTTDITSANFGKWNGSLSSPRVMQLSGRFEF